MLVASVYTTYNLITMKSKQPQFLLKVRGNETLGLLRDLLSIRILSLRVKPGRKKKAGLDLIFYFRKL